MNDPKNPADRKAIGRRLQDLPGGTSGVIFAFGGANLPIRRNAAGMGYRSGQAMLSLHTPHICNSRRQPADDPVMRIRSLLIPNRSPLIRDASWAVLTGMRL